MGDNDDKNSKKKKSKKTTRTGTTQIQIANEDLEILGDSEQPWHLTDKRLLKKNKETKGKGYHTEGEKPQKKRKTRSTSDNENNPMDIPTDMAMHNLDTHLIQLSATSIHPPGPISHHQREKLDINLDEPGTSYNPSRIDPTQPRMRLRSQTTFPAQIPNKPVGKPESQHKANYETTISGMQALSYKLQIEEDEPVSEDDCISSSEDDTGDEKTDHREENPNPEELGEEYFDPPHEAPIKEKSWSLERTPLNKPFRQPPHTLPNCPPTRLKPLVPRHTLPRDKEPPKPFQNPQMQHKFLQNPQNHKENRNPKNYPKTHQGK
jgi:hypothetical protein